MRALLLLVVVAGCHASSPTRPDLATRAAPALEALDPAQLETDTKYLASDALEGRAPGTPGGDKAEEYIAQRYRQIGLQPGGEHGTYFQTVPLRSAEKVSASFVVHGSAGDVAFEDGKDVLIRPWTRAPSLALDAPLVFVGYGVDRADLGYDDLSGVDLHGGIAVVFAGAPRTLAGKPVDSALHAVLAAVGDRTPTLRDHGAAGVVIVYDPVRAQKAPWADYVRDTPPVVMDWLEHGVVASNPVLPIAIVDSAGLDRIIGSSMAHALWEQLDRGEHPHVELHATASVRVESKLSDVTARNVIGVLPGGDLADEYVAYTAHHDHLGVGKPVKGDAIYNGAIDNAIGVAEILEVARAMKALKHPPRRSVLFVAVTAEERGLLGSDYFADHPTVPIERIVADVNVDGGTPNQEVFDVIAMGAEHSTLGAAALAASRAAGLLLSPDPEPELVLFVRSDQYSFVKRGIPAIFTGEGFRDAHGNTAVNEAASNQWAAERYHQPSDEWLPSYHGTLTLPELRFETLLGLAVADADTRPQWNPGDVFAAVGKPAARRDSRQPLLPAVDASAKRR
jgi:hypothetical protein